MGNSNLNMQLSVIILNYNVRYFLELCLKSVQAATVNLDAEIIVVDNNSQDESCVMVKRLFPRVILIENKENLGFSKGNNIAVAQAKGEYICILNPDTVVAEDTFIQLLNFSTKQNNLGIVGCKLIDGTGRFLPESKRNIPTPLVSLQKIFGYTKTYYANRLDENEIGKADIFVGAFMLIKRSVFNRVDGFDEDYFMYGDDIDLSYKMLKAGFDNYYFGETIVIHYKGESTLKDEVYAKRFYGAMQIFYKKHFKRYIIFDTMVWLGIKFASLFRSKSTILKNKIDNYVLVSNQIDAQLKTAVSKDIELVSHIKPTKKNIEIIFDTNALSYKEIIAQLSNYNEYEMATYKILSKDSNYIIGSNGSKTRGEVIIF